MANDIDPALEAAIIATDREIAAEAWGQEAADLEDSGDRSLEEMGEGLEGQHEDEEAEEGEAEGEESAEAEAAEGDQEVAEQTAKKPGEQEPSKPEPQAKPGETEPRRPGTVPPAVHRQVGERARAAETERDALKAQLETERNERNALNAKVDGILATLQRQQPVQQTQQPPKTEIIPDLFEDPKGFVEYQNRTFQSELSRRDQALNDLRVENSMQIAHAIHKDGFTQAFAAIQKLNPQDPESQMTVRRIYGSPNPGEELVQWHRRNETLRRVGNDPAAYEERLIAEAREKLMKDPDFRAQLLEDLRAEASGADNGRPRTITRLPKSLNGVAGSSTVRDSSVDLDGSEQAIADSAWR